MKQAKRVVASEEDSLRLRVLKVKAVMPRGFDYTTLYKYEFGEINQEQTNQIRMVWNLRATDELITKRLEKIADNLKNA